MRLTFTLLIAVTLSAEVKNLSLSDVVQLSLRENPDIVLARIDEQKASLAIRVAKDPFRPKVIAGSGLAYSYGFPMSIEGSAPSIVQARAIASIFNKPLSYRVAQVTEEARGAVIDTHIRRDQVVLQAATLFLEAGRWARIAEAISGQVPGLARTAEMVQLRVKEGRELEIEVRRAALALLKTRHRLDLIQQDREAAETTLATLLGMTAADRAHPVQIGPLTLPMPATEEEAVDQALGDSNELRRLESSLLAKRHELRQYKSNHLPSIDLVAQYGLFAKFNNYEDYFQRFQRHNGQLGVSLQIPVFRTAASIAQSAQADAELSALRTRVTRTRNNIAVTTQTAFRQLKLAEKSRELARTDLEIAREQVTLTLAVWEEGRATQRQLEEARFQEQEKWIAYHDSQFLADRAKLELLRSTGKLLSALQ